eukprot:CAMPEP_0118931926 /NCGR_PEP_ID=MMETSP1169-20130426/8713_1 /TAXON_ID=36882 /ORGANISM="Pyramimonas obovata, Strain CCMP722" /LENGTH=94 /DNA_ID=CAMNT_0006874503 /DNA_START=68 /DNA_END=352 /DNA_ORIENTATION=+
MAAFTVSAVAIAPTSTVAVRATRRPKAVVCKAAEPRAAAFTDSAKMNNDDCEYVQDVNTDAIASEGCAVHCKKAKCVHPERPVANACADCPRKK